MADPISISAAVGMAATAIGGGMAAYGKEQEGQFGQKIKEYQARIAENNAVYDQMLSQRKAGIKGMEERAQYGDLVRTQAGAGLDVMRGSNRLVQTSQQALGRIPQQDIMETGERQAANERQQAKLDIAAGRQLKYAGDLGAATTLADTTAKVATKWYQGKSMGLYGGGGIDTGIGLSPFGGSRLFG